MLDSVSYTAYTTSMSDITIIIHSSKTMKPSSIPGLRAPQLIDATRELSDYVSRQTESVLGKAMHISPALAGQTRELFMNWSDAVADSSTAIDSFRGDIYSGLRAAELDERDRAYADEHLVILSGLYGLLRPLDAIAPYRLEPAYRFADEPYRNIYTFWGDRIARLLPSGGPIINVSSVEYMKLITPYIDASRIITPRFMTVHPKTGVPTFVVVHAKIARGAFARWMIKERIEDVSQLAEFSDLGYRYMSSGSTPDSPLFVCESFDGRGLSVRLTA